MPDHEHTYQRYHIDTQPAPDLVPWPNQFRVEVNRFYLAKLLLSEIIHQRGDVKAITSRPCVYGTFSGPIGGFAPRPQHCVACLRCTTQHPETVTIRRNPDRMSLGDSFLTWRYVNAIAYESQTGSIPVKGAGYRGRFGGEGWDGMWTDMSEIVRPTRDGIHGREFISTVVDIGEKPAYLSFDEKGQLDGEAPRVVTIPVPLLYDRPPASAASASTYKLWSQAAAETQTLAVLPIAAVLREGLRGEQIIPLVEAGEEDLLSELDFQPAIIEVKAPATASLLERLKKHHPESIIAVRMPYPNGEALLDLYDRGVRVFHLLADFHGYGPGGRFVIDLIREAHMAFVDAGLRDSVTLIGSGGIIAAEHVPKAIICGLDAVALDTPLLVALQAQFEGDCIDRRKSQFRLPKALAKPDSFAWGVQRLKNMTAAWRDQLLEILGAMGLREVRRLRGEMGRAMFMANLEREAFGEIEGFESTTKQGSN
jgi:hypothetical protein